MFYEILLTAKTNLYSHQNIFATKNFTVTPWADISVSLNLFTACQRTLMLKNYKSILYVDETVLSVSLLSPVPSTKETNSDFIIIEISLL